MGTRAIVLGMIGALLCLAPLPVAAQRWSVQVEAVPSFDFRTKFDNGSSTKHLKNAEGILLSVGTPFHIGFGLESYKGGLEPNPSHQIELNVWMTNVYVDIPVPLVTFHVGAGWGNLSFDPERVASGTDSSTLEKINLWEWFARLGIPLPFNLDLLVGYHEANGKFVIRHNSGNAPDRQDSTVTITTVGLGYTF